MIKILFFIPGLSEGGAEKVLRNLVNNMDQTKFDITVQTIENCDAENYLAQGIHYKAMNRCKTRLGRRLFEYFFRLCAELKLAYRMWVKDDYDIEVAYLETAATKIIAQSTNKKAVKLAWVHCDLTKKEGIKQSKEKIEEQYTNYDKIVCVSKDVEEGFHKLFGMADKTVVLYNVIDDEEILRKAEEPLDWNVKQGQKKLLAVGRLTEQKDFAYLIQTCGQLRAAGYPFYLNILGEGPERKRLEKQLEKWKLEECVNLQGYVENPYPWIKTADAVICSSKYEGFSSVIVEALILGKTVISTACTGMRELLGNSVYGMIADEAEGLYDCMKLFLTDPSVELHYEEMAEKRREDFSKRKILAITEEFFYDLSRN